VMSGRHNEPPRVGGPDWTGAGSGEASLVTRGDEVAIKEMCQIFDGIQDGATLTSATHCTIQYTATHCNTLQLTHSTTL